MKDRIDELTWEMECGLGKGCTRWIESNMGESRVAGLTYMHPHGILLGHMEYLKMILLLR